MYWRHSVTRPFGPRYVIENFSQRSFLFHEASCFFLVVEEQGVCVSANTVGVF